MCFSCFKVLYTLLLPYYLLNGANAALIQRNVEGDFILNFNSCDKFGMFRYGDKCKCPKDKTFMKSSDNSQYACLDYPTIVEDCSPLMMADITKNPDAAVRSIVPMLTRNESSQQFETDIFSTCGSAPKMSLHVLNINDTFVYAKYTTSEYFFVIRNDIPNKNEAHFTIVKAHQQPQMRDITEDYPGKILKIYITGCPKFYYCLYFKVGGKTEWISGISPSLSSSIKPPVSTADVSMTVIVASTSSTVTMTSSSSQTLTKSLTPSTTITSISSSSVIITTTERPTSEELSSENGAIIGVAVAIAILFLIIIVIFIFLVYRKRKNNKNTGFERAESTGTNQSEHTKGGPTGYDNDAYNKYGTAHSTKSLSDVVIRAEDDESPESPYQNIPSPQKQATSTFFIEDENSGYNLR